MAGSGISKRTKASFFRTDRRMECMPWQGKRNKAKGERDGDRQKERGRKRERKRKFATAALAKNPFCGAHERERLSSCTV